MWDVGWPFYGLDQVEVAADGDFDSYFNELLSAAGMDLLRLPVWNTASGQTDGLYGEDRAIVHDPAAMLLYPAAAADGQESLQESFPFQPVVSRLSDGLPDIQSRAGVSGGMPGVLFPMLALREDAQEQDVLWAVDALSAGQEQLWSRAVGLPDETDVLSVEMLPVVQGYPDDGIRLGLDTPSGQLDAAGGNLWKKAAASSVAVSPVTVSSRADGVWGAAQQLPFSGAASDGGKAASGRQQADSVEEFGGLMTALSGVDGYLPAELMWEQEDRLLDRLERRLGQEIANSTEGAFG